MQWKELEQHIHDNYAVIPEAEVEKISTELLKNLEEDVTPLQAAKIAYALVLLQLKSDSMDEKKALQFAEHLVTILRHEIRETESNESDRSVAHLLYVRKLAEHYFHHLMVVAELMEADMIVEKLGKYRLKNHERLLTLQRSNQSLWQREQKVIKRAIRKYYLLAAFLLATALYFTWTTFWSLMDAAVGHWIYSEYSAASVGELIQQVLLLGFSACFVWGFVKYQQGSAEEE